MKAVVWHGVRDVRVEEVPDPVIHSPTDAIVRVTSTAICGSDLHLYEMLGAFMDEGDILGHEAMGIVEAVGSEVTQLAPGDRVVVPFNIACGSCFMCDLALYAQCESTQVREHGTGAAIFGYSRLYGSVPGGQAEYVRVPQAHFGPIPVPHGPPDERFLYLSDVLPTAWQAVEYADVSEGGTVAVFGAGPVGQMCTRIARLRGARVVAIDLVPERLEMARRHGIDTLHWDEVDDLPEALLEFTGGHGADSVIDAVGMEAHGSRATWFAQRVAAYLPEAVGAPLMQRAGVDRLAALLQAIDTVRRGGTLSITGVYGGAADPLPMLRLFDKGVTVRMGQAHVRRWTDDLLPLVMDDSDPLGVGDLATHRLPLEEAAYGYDIFQRKEDGAIKVVLAP